MYLLGGAFHMADVSREKNHRIPRKERNHVPRVSMSLMCSGS